MVRFTSEVSGVDGKVGAPPTTALNGSGVGGGSEVFDVTPGVKGVGRATTKGSDSEGSCENTS